MKKILIIDESSLIRNYLTTKLASCNFETISAINGLDGMAKMRNNDPDLIIMDYFLSRKSIQDILKDKADNPNIANTPIIILSSKLEKEQIAFLVKNKISKILSKPIRIDRLYKAISSILKTELTLDTTPCIIEAHLNNDILFIEIADGLNMEKLELLQYKITELLKSYKISKPKVLIIISNISQETATNERIKLLLDIIISQTKSPLKAIKILTTSTIVNLFLKNNKMYNKIEVVNNLEKTLSELINLKVSAYDEESKNALKEDFLTHKKDIHVLDENIHLKFEKEFDAVINNENPQDNRKIEIAIIDDDVFIHEFVRACFSTESWTLNCFENGQTFLKDLENSVYDIIFLDLNMPGIDGFKILQYIENNNIPTPVIILSAFSQIQTVKKALSFGVKSYLIKPLRLDIITEKAKIVLNRNF